MRLIEEQVAALVRRGVPARLLTGAGQEYVHTSICEIPVPPWGTPKHEVLVAIPTTYDTAPLDGFYLALPHIFNGGLHPRVNGQVVELEERKWQLVSWHYTEERPWRRGQDDLDSHIGHCRGFFLHRGAKNDR